MGGADELKITVHSFFLLYNVGVFQPRGILLLALDVKYEQCKLNDHSRKNTLRVK